MSGYTALPTKNPGDVLTSALWNTYLQGNADSGFARKLADTTLGVAAASIDFTSIPATFAHLLLVANLRGDAVASTVNGLLRMNNDSGGNYLYETLTAALAAVSSAGVSGATAIQFSDNIPAASATVNVFAPLFILIPDYLNVVATKTALAQSLYAPSPALKFAGGHWGNVNAINRLTLLLSSGNLLAGSRATLYGLPA